MKKIKLTQIESNLLNQKEMKELYGGYYWCLCQLWGPGENDHNTAAVGQNTTNPGPGTNPGRPPSSLDCPCFIIDPIGSGDTATSYLTYKP